MAIVGFSAGLLHIGDLPHAISPITSLPIPLGTVNLAGSLCSALDVSPSQSSYRGRFYLYTAAAVQVWIAVIPAMFGWMYRRTTFPAQPAEPALDPPPPHNTLSELRSTGAVLLSLLLFFQLGNEWALAGWLPLFLSQRLGISPPSALGMLALYWLALTVGRAAPRNGFSRA